jgi:hypothetical protein
VAKVDWITWKTDTKDIINPETIKEKILEDYMNYNTYMTSVVYEGLNYELTRGGLNQSTFSINGLSPANEVGKEIINKIDEIKVKVNNIIDEAYTKAKEQKAIEKKQLIKAIDEKLNEEEKILNNTINAREKFNNSNLSALCKELDESIEYTTLRIKRLKERLDLANSL